MADDKADTAVQAAETPVAPVSLFKKRGAKAKANFRKRPATPPRDDDSDSDYTSSEDESGQRVKRRKRNAVVTASSKNNAATQHESATVFSADRDVPITITNDATKQANWFDEDANLLGKTRAMQRPAADGEENTLAQSNGTYRGLANQTKFIQKNPNAPTRTVGPIRASEHIRTTTEMDYKPDVCKDYKKTGWCGYGDSCKFAHIREDFEQGWQMESEFQKFSKGKKSLGGKVVASADRHGSSAKDDDAADAALLENIPFACIICEGPYKSPIVTRCGHYFCERCALERYRKDPSCAACGAGTGGVFNAAKTLNRLLERKRERAAKMRQKAIEAGEEVEDEDVGTAK